MKIHHAIQASLAVFLVAAAPSPATDIYVDSQGSGDGSSPSSPLSTIRAAVQIAGSGDTIWVRGGTGRSYSISSDSDAIDIATGKNGLTIRSFGDEGLALISVSENYVPDGGRASIVSVYADNVTLDGLRFEWGTYSLGKQKVASCSLIDIHGMFLTISGCEFEQTGSGSTYETSGNATAIIYCHDIPATDLTVTRCSFFRCRMANDNIWRGYKLLSLRDNARISECVFSNCADIVRPSQVKINNKDYCCSSLAFVSNIVYDTQPDSKGQAEPGIIIGGYAGPKVLEIAYNLFVNDPSKLYNCVLRKSRECGNGSPPASIHHNTVIGFRNFLYLDTLNINSSAWTASIFNNLLALEPTGTNIVEDVSKDKNGVYMVINGNKPMSTSFKSGSFFRNNAMFAPTLNGGTAEYVTSVTYDITAGLSVFDNVPMTDLPDFITLTDYSSPNFGRYRENLESTTVIPIGTLGWTGNNGEYPRWIGAKEPQYPESTLITIH